MTVLEIENLKKTFTTPEGTTATMVDLPRWELSARAQVALRGASGSGKTTLLHLIAGILRPDSGSIRLDGTELTTLSESVRDRLRATKIGYVFQAFNLLQGYSCLENVLVAMRFGAGANRASAEALLTRVGMGDRLHYRPRQLSAGQQQRVAVARALANRPRLVLADEPTGNLDPKNARATLSLIRELCAEEEAALLLTSHDADTLRDFEDVRDLAPGPDATGGGRP